MKPVLRSAAIGSFLVTVLATVTGWAQTNAGANITGRVYNPATREYVRNAEIHIEGTNLVAYSGDEGSYILTNVPAGTVRLTLSYTG